MVKIIFDSKLTYYLPKIAELKKQTSLERQDLLQDEFLLEEEKALRMYYAPHNEMIHTAAKVMIVGITPGWHQMKTAYLSVMKSFQNNEQKIAILRHAKIAAGFSGQMRVNLYEMLDEIGLANIFGWRSSAQLFTINRDLLHTTSLIRYPVFLNGTNYTGHTPPIRKSKLLSHYAYTIFPQELNQMSSTTLVIPLGKAVEQAIQFMIKEGKLQGHTFLFGFPHPSGANGHRRRQLKENKQQLEKMVRQYGEQVN